MTKVVLDKIGDKAFSMTSEEFEKAINNALGEGNRKIVITKGGPGSGNFGHAGRPGKVGGSLPGGKGVGGKAYQHFATRARDGDYEDKGILGNQGMQATTRLIEMEGGMPAIQKDYSYGLVDMRLSDAAAYEIAHALDINEVPMTVDVGKGTSIQRFVNNSITWDRYGTINEGKNLFMRYGMDAEQFDRMLLFDVLIGNKDRNAGNLLIHLDTKRLSFIDNSSTLGKSYVFDKDYHGAIEGIVTWNNIMSPFGGVLNKLTKSGWDSFASKARGDEVYDIVMNKYGGVIGKQVYLDMMGRLDAFEKHYANPHYAYDNPPSWIDDMEEARMEEKGSASSGHYGHAGRPGKVGGSAPGTGYGVGLYAQNTFKRGKAMWSPTGEFVKSTNRGNNSHTQIAARIIVDNPDKYTSETVADAKKVVERNWVEYPIVESPVHRQGFVSVEVNFMGNITLVTEGKSRYPTIREFNSLFQRTKKGIRRGKFDVKGAEQVAIHYGDKVWSGTFHEMDMISGFTLNQWGNPVPYMKESKRIRVVKGSVSSGHYGHAGRPGKVGGSMPGGAMAPGGEAYEHFYGRVKLGYYEDKGMLGNQGSQATTRLLELEGGMPAVYKAYGEGNQRHSLNDEVVYDLSQVMDMNDVPMAMELGRGESVQRFVTGSKTLSRYINAGHRPSGEQLDEAMLFDILIGNTDRHGDNMMVHENSGRIFLIDNSYSLPDSYLFGMDRYNVTGWVDSIISNYKNMAPDVTRRLTESEWDSFNKKARSSGIYDIIIDKYGEIAGPPIHESMMTRMDIFEEMYAPHLQD